MRIGIATGGASHSDIAVRVAGKIAAETGSELLVLTVIGQEKERVRAAQILERAVSLTNLPPERIQTRIRVGKTARQIVLEAEESALDLLVLGNRPEHRLVHRLTGPTANKVLAMTKCPVILARHEPDRFARFLVCEAGRVPSLLERTLVRLRPLLASAEEITVLHVMSQITAAPGIEGWELRAEAPALMAGQTVEGEWLSRHVELLEKFPLKLHARVRHGLVLDEILAETNEGIYDIVVIGKHQQSGWERFLLDDLSRQIIIGVNLSILVV